MKRQVEEAEEEIDRLESSKKKLQRELEDQIGVNEQLQGQLNSMKKGLRWVKAAAHPSPQPPPTTAQCFQSVLSPPASRHVSTVVLWGHPILEVKVAVSAESHVTPHVQ